MCRSRQFLRDVIYDSRALIVFLHITTDPSWQWWPTKINCSVLKTTGNSSIRIECNFKCDKRGAPAPTHVQQTTARQLRLSIAAISAARYCFLCCKFDCSIPRSWRASRWPHETWHTHAPLLNWFLDFFSVSWSMAVLLGAQANTGPPFWPINWYAIVHDVNVFPVSAK